MQRVGVGLFTRVPQARLDLPFALDNDPPICYTVCEVIYGQEVPMVFHRISPAYGAAEGIAMPRL